MDLFKRLQYDTPETRPLIHIGFWLGYLIFFSLLWGSYDDAYAREFVIVLLELPVKIALCYISLYLLMPRYLYRQHYLAFFLWLSLAVMLGGIAQRGVVMYFIYPMYFPEEAGQAFWSLPKIIKYIISINSILVFTGGIKVLKRWYKDQKDAETLQQERLAAELKFLKAQIHPHFLFNTLNNLYSLTLKKSDAAPEMVLKLSNLLSYMLHDANAPRVLLSKEIEYINNYIALEKIRFGDRFELNFTTSGEIGDKLIAPMLLLPFVENSFKHGVASATEDAWINIDLSVKNHFLTLKVENSKPDALGFNPDEAAFASGIGLRNVRRRLELLYQDQYDMKTFDEAESYLIVLKLNLSGFHDTQKPEQQ